MAQRRMSWTTKFNKALVLPTIEAANDAARSMLGSPRYLDCHLQWVSSQHGWVIYNLEGTKMIADR